MKKNIQTKELKTAGFVYTQNSLGFSRNTSIELHLSAVFIICFFFHLNETAHSQNENLDGPHWTSIFFLQIAPMTLRLVAYNFFERELKNMNFHLIFAMLY